MFVFLYKYVLMCFFIKGTTIFASGERLCRLCFASLIGEIHYHFALISSEICTYFAIPISGTYFANDTSEIATHCAIFTSEMRPKQTPCELISEQTHLRNKFAKGTPDVNVPQTYIIREQNTRIRVYLFMFII